MMRNNFVQHTLYEVIREIEEKKESYYIQVMKILNDSKGKIKSEVVTNWTNQYAKGKKVNDLTPTEFTNLVNFLEHYEQV